MFGYLQLKNSGFISLVLREAKGLSFKLKSFCIADHQYLMEIAQSYIFPSYIQYKCLMRLNIFNIEST